MLARLAVFLLRGPRKAMQGVQVRLLEGAEGPVPFAAQRLSDTRRPDVVLTPRMEEVRQLLRQGMSNKRIASQLGLSEGTVKNYMSEIFRALNVSNRTQAAQMDADTL